MPPVWVAKTMEQGVVIGACIVSAATATEVGASGVKRSPWANAAFIPGALGDYMEAQFQFFTNPKLNKNGGRPIIAGLNYFLTDEARGGSSKKLLGEKRDVKVWLSWLDRRFHNEVGAIETPIGYIPQFGDLKILFKSLINKDYTEDLYIKQFSLYLDNIIARIDLQRAAYANEKNLPATCFNVLDDQKAGLLELKKRFGEIVKPMDLV
jgi:phosphoenolpyruvate carboxykinase (GTP)